MAKSIRIIAFVAVLALAIEVDADAAERATGASSDETPGAPAYTNRLIDSNDPYLLLHAHNPVDWYPWGPEALAKAKRENRPIFLSVGYSTCYWCHVAEKTIYSQPEFAELMNSWFVNIKVDREERPDLDRVYMLATEVLTGHGGWPNNVFLTPDLKPFFAGSYFPPHDDAFGRPGFSTILKKIHETWLTHPERVIEAGNQVYASLQQYQAQGAESSKAPSNPQAWLAQAVSTLPQRFDPEHGGFRSGGGTKFPQEPLLEMLLVDYRVSGNTKNLDILKKTLDAMAFGGVYDQLAGGFHRYSTEATWSIPHFEKMLYDNAQLLKIYAQAHALSGNALYRQMAMGLADYLSQEMTASDGGFYTAQDAEVDGKEGASYLWTHEEIASVLGEEDARKFFAVYALTPMPDQSALQTEEQTTKGEEKGVIRIRLPIEEALQRTGQREVVGMLSAAAPLRAKLLAARNRRAQPLRDEKIVVGLNGLAIEAFTEAGQLLRKPGYLTLARGAADRIWSVAYDSKTGELEHEIFRGRAQTQGYLDDYALLGKSFLALFEATQEPAWRHRAESLAGSILKRFVRADGTLATSSAEKDLLIPPQDDGDNTQPSGTSAAINLLLRVGVFTGKPDYGDAAWRVVARLSGQLQQHPEFWPTLVAAVSAPGMDSAMATGRGNTATAAQSQGAPQAFQPLSTADFVRAAATAYTKDDHDEIVVTLTITRGYHVNANPASFDYLIPTSVSFDGITTARIGYPPPTLFKPEFAPEGLNVYEGTSTIVAVLPKGTLKKGETLRATVNAQACNNKICLPPGKLHVTITSPGG